MLDAFVAVVMLTAGIAIHAITWAVILDYISQTKKVVLDIKNVTVSVFILLVGSFLILTSIMIVVKTAAGTL